MILAFSQPKRVCDFLKFCRIYADVGLALLTAIKDNLANLEDLTAMGLQGSSDLIIGE